MIATTIGDANALVRFPLLEGMHTVVFDTIHIEIKPSSDMSLYCLVPQHRIELARNHLQSYNMLASIHRTL